MSIRRFTAVRLVALVSGVTIAGGHPVAQSTHVLVSADTTQWGPAPPSLPKGAQISVLEGNPSARGEVTLRLKFPANYDIPPHWHSTTERVTVLSGEFHVGMRDQTDRQASQALGPGGFVLLPAAMHHFAWTASPTVVQLNLQGPFDIFYVNPADDPRKQTREQ